MELDLCCIDSDELGTAYRMVLWGHHLPWRSLRFAWKSVIYVLQNNICTIFLAFYMQENCAFILALTLAPGSYIVISKECSNTTELVTLQRSAMLGILDVRFRTRCRSKIDLYHYLRRERALSSHLIWASRFKNKRRIASGKLRGNTDVPVVECHVKVVFFSTEISIFWREFGSRFSGPAVARFLGPPYSKYSQFRLYAWPPFWSPEFGRIPPRIHFFFWKEEWSSNPSSPGSKSVLFFIRPEKSWIWIFGGEK